MISKGKSVNLSLKVPQKDPPTRAGLPALTGLRFLAAFYVVLFHGLSWIEQRLRLPGFLRQFLQNGTVAVSLFFLLSGFILSYTYCKKLDAGHAVGNFWIARFARIYPVYALSMLIALPFQLHLSVPIRLAVLAMVQAWNPFHQEWAGAWNYPAWSLSVEAFFYLVFPFLQRWIEKINYRSLAIIAVMSTIWCVIAGTPLQSIGVRYNLAFGLALGPLPIVRFPEFLIGVCLGNHFVRSGFFFRSSSFVYVSALVALALLSLPIGTWASLVVIPFAAMIYSLASQSTMLSAYLSSRLMILLGEASYSLYLLQAPVRDLMRVVSNHVPAAFARLATPATPIVLVLFSLVVFRIWEEPCRRTIRKWLAPPRKLTA
jgi:peptidoglycan/LPS O-acetylase OafA/YrhL